MAFKTNSEFNYRTQIMGETIWAKIQYLLGFLEAKKRGVALEAVHAKKHEANIAKLAYLQEH